MTPKGRGRGAGGLRGLDAVPPSAPSSTTAGEQQASLPASNVDNTPASLPASQPPEPAADPGMQWGISDLVGGIDPEKDRHQSGIRLPKYVMEAMRLHAVLTRREQQDIAADGVKRVLPPQLLDETYRRLYGRERPKR